jgi:hypothetical protein
MRAIVQKLFPWLKGLRIVTGGGLSFRTAGGLLHLQGEPGDPAAARKGDAVDGGGFAFYPGVPGTTPPSLWYTSDQSEPYTWSQVSVCLITGPLTTDAGTRVAGVITTGSEKVTCA